MRDIKWARNILGNAFVLTFLLSAVLITCSMLYLDDILRAFGGSDQTIPYAKDYLRIVIPGSVLSNLSYSFSNIMRASGYPSKSMYTILIGVGLNILLDPLFIFGFGMEIKGAAVATVISMFVSSLFVLSHFFNPKHPVHFRRDCWVPKKRIIRNIVSIGMAPFLMNLAASIVNVIMNNQLVREGGDLAIGAFGIINSYGILIVMTAMGLCQGCSRSSVQLRSPEAQAYERRAQVDDPDRYADHGGRLRGLRAGAATPRPRFHDRSRIDRYFGPGASACICHAAGRRVPDRGLYFFPVHQQGLESDFHGALPAGDFLDTGPLFLFSLVRPDGRLAQYSVRGFSGVAVACACFCFPKRGCSIPRRPVGYNSCSFGKGVY